LQLWINTNNRVSLIQVLAIPAVPLTMSAGLLFGSVTGTIMVSISGTVSNSGMVNISAVNPAVVHFLIELYRLCS
jgi:hypothetical protein